MLKKLILYTAIYALITFFLSNDWNCILDPDSYCLVNVLAKYIVFMLLIVIFDKFIKKKIFKNEK